MMKFCEPLHHIPSLEQAKELWCWLLGSPARWYETQILLMDAHGDLYYTTDPIIIVQPEQHTTRITFVTRTTATKELRLMAYRLACKDVKGYLPPKFDTIKGGGVDGADLTIKLDQYFEIAGGVFPQNTHVLPQDLYIPTVALTIPNGMLTIQV